MRSSVSRSLPSFGQVVAMLVMFISLISPWSRFFVLGITEGLLQGQLLILFGMIYIGWRSRYSWILTPLLAVLVIIHAAKTFFFDHLPWWTATWWVEYGHTLLVHVKQLPALTDAFYESVFQLSGFLLISALVAVLFFTHVYQREHILATWATGFVSFFLLEITIQAASFWGVAGYFTSVVYLWASIRGRHLSAEFPEISAAHEQHRAAWFGLVWKVMALALLLALVVRDTTPRLTLFNPLYDQVITQLEPYLPASINDDDGDGWRTGRLGSYNRQDQTIVMRVASPRPLYWRREAMTVYDGERWDYDPRLVDTNRLPGSAAPYDWPLPDAHQMKEITARVTLLTAPTMGQPTQLAVPHGYEMQIDMGELETAIVADENGNYHAQVRYHIPSPASYTTTVWVPTYDEELLRRTRTADPTLIWAYQTSENLQLPGSLPKRVRDLATQITTVHGNDYDKVRAIERYLSTSYDYTLRTSPPLVGTDFVDHFLFTSKKGYCVHFSTAMVVMLRSVGIPARWVTGFAPGEYDSESREYIVRRKDAHAWVEVYFEGIGWVEFEPTPSFFSHQLIRRPSVDEEDPELGDEDDRTELGSETPTPKAIPAIGLPAGGSTASQLELRWSWWWVMVLAIPMAFYRRRLRFATRVLFRRWRLNRAHRRVDRPWIDALYREMLIICRQLNLPLPQNLTPYEHLEKLVAQRPHWSVWLRSLTNEYVKSRFGRFPVGDDKNWRELWAMMEAAVKAEEIGV